MTHVFGSCVEPGCMELNEGRDALPAEIRADQKAKDREIALASLNWLTTDDFLTFAAGIRQAA